MTEDRGTQSGSGESGKVKWTHLLQRLHCSIEVYPTSLEQTKHENFLGSWANRCGIRVEV